MTQSRFRYELVWLPLLLLGILGIYLPGLDNPLVFDDSYLADGSLFRDYAFWDEWRMRLLSYGSFVWLQELFGDGWWKQRLANVALHIGVVIALWGLYRELLSKVEPPRKDHAGAAVAPVRLQDSPALGLAIAFFAVNPVAVYAVGYLIQRSIVMATLFVVAGLWAFARGVQRHSAAWHVLALLCYVLAVASKEHAILAPLAALPVYVLLARPTMKRLLVIAVIVGAVVAGAAGVLVLRYGEVIGQPFDEASRVYVRQLAALNPEAPKHAYSLSVINQAWLFFEYGLRWLVPYTGWMSINLRPPFPLTWTTFPQALGIVGYAATLAGGAWLLLRYRDWRALMGLSLLLPAILFGTEFATVWIQDPFVLYRSYLWAIGIPGFVFCIAHGPSPRVMLAVGGIVASVVAVQAFDRVMSMDTVERAWTDAIVKQPKDERAVGRWLAYLNRGSAYLDRDEMDMALNDFSNSSRLGDMGLGVFNMGVVLSAKGQHAKALDAFDRAEKEGYDLYNLPVQRGLSLAALGRMDEAYRELDRARRLAPPSPTREVVMVNLGRIALQTNNSVVAIRELEPLVALQPRNKEARYLLGMAYVLDGQNARGRDVFDALLLEERSVPSFYGRALANFQLKRKAEASRNIEEAVRGDPGNAQLRALRERILALP